MNCNCISDTEKKIAEYMQSQAGDNAKAACDIAGFTLGQNDLAVALLIPFRVKGSKKGYTSEKGKTINMTASFCPFCGVSTKKAKPEAA